MPASIVYQAGGEWYVAQPGERRIEEAGVQARKKPAHAGRSASRGQPSCRRIKVSPVALEGQADTFLAAGLLDQRAAAASRASRSSSRAREAAAQRRAAERRPAVVTGPVGWIRACMRVTGIPGDWYAGLWTIAQRESGFDPHAYNGWDANAAAGEPSRGLFQTTGPTFRTHHQPGTPWDIDDPVANCAAAVNYIKAQYGDIAHVQQADAARPPTGY